MQLDCIHKLSTAQIVKEEAIKSKVIWEGINYKETARYVAIHCQPWEITMMIMEEGNKRQQTRHKWNRSAKQRS